MDEKRLQDERSQDGFNELIENWSTSSARRFHKQMSGYGLTAEAIASQNVEGLEHSLRRLDRLLTSVQRAMEVASTSERLAATEIYNSLLELKFQALQRLLGLRKGQERPELEQAVNAAVENPTSARELLVQLREKVDQQVEEEAPLQAQILQTQKAQLDLDHAAALSKADLADRKSALYRKWIERETIASIVGAILVLGFATILVVAMFRGVPPTEIVTSAFLLVLGYFFGQRTSNSKHQSGESDS